MRILISNFTGKLGQKRVRIVAGTILIVLLSAYLLTYSVAVRLDTIYSAIESPTIKDRYGEIIKIQPNKQGYYARRMENIPQDFKKLLLKKEDRFFYYHPGINPFSILRDAISYLVRGRLAGSSTITQQLAKILLGNEQKRTIRNKLLEAIYAISLELYTPKNKILTMYINTVYFGNRAQGLEEASLFYFNKPPESLTNEEILKLLAALNKPSGRYPGSPENRKIVPRLANILGLTLDTSSSDTKKSAEIRNNSSRKNKTSFEIDTLGIKCHNHCQLTIDKVLTETIRDILKRNLNLPSFLNADNGAIVAIKLPENELLAIAGSPNPQSLASGYQINMAIQARPIGSTAKPFIYLNAFEKGARPYSLVEDQEYAYKIGTGFAFYPKNYDGQYRGTVTLHQALSNSLNVPAVKVLEYVGLEKMYTFLRDSLGFKSIQPLQNYELGIALGALEMDLLTLSHYFTIFPNEGALKPLKIFADNSRYLISPMGPEISEEKRVSQKEFSQLINKILSDRETGIEQFGMKSNLNLIHDYYALKTGTSRDFHDSWTMGYTPDFLVGVWLGNSDNTPMRQISGQTGAGKIWHEVMELLLGSPYNKRSSFNFGAIKEFSISGTIEYGLADDDYESIRYLLEEQSLITQPHDGDTFLYEEKAQIPLRAKKSVSWFINEMFLEKNTETSWHPPQPGFYSISARSEGGNEQRIRIRVEEEK